MQQSKLNQIKETKIAQDGIYELTYQEEERDGGDGDVGAAARWLVVWRWLTQTKRDLNQTNTHGLQYLVYNF